MTIICGADPGLSGALAFLDAETRRVLGIIDMPVAASGSGRRQLLLRDLVVDVAGTLDGRRVGHIFIERQQPFASEGKKMGAASAFALGECYMAVKMIAAASGWPMTIVTPQEWKRSFSLSRDKDEARAAASRIMPEDAGLWTVRRGYCTKERAIGRCEAALIGWFGIQSFVGIATAA